METCPICEPVQELADGRTFVMRHLVPDDVDGLHALYQRLGTEDLQRRFFTGGPPPPGFVEAWTSLAERDGLGLAVDLIDGDGTRLAAEAGYSLLASGDGELGIAVEPASRGWLGPWLLNALLNHANDRGVANLQAVMLCDNRAMMALATKRGFAVRDHPDWGVIRVTMATQGHVPSWGPNRDRPRVVVEANRSRWRAEEAFLDAGFEIALCLGPCGSLDDCPVLAGESCPLIGGADAVVVDLDPGDPSTEALLRAEADVHPGVRLVAGMALGDDGTAHHRSPGELLAELDDLIDRDHGTEQRRGAAPSDEGTMGSVTGEPKHGDCKEDVDSPRGER